jgi:hypothetical protein
MVKPREFLTSASGILALVFTILGVVFFGAGAVMVAFGSVSQVADAPFAVSGTLWGIGVPFLIIGGIVGTVGIVIGMRRMRLLRLREQLRAHGHSVDATIVHVSQEFRVRVNRRHPWLIQYQYEVGGVAYRGSETMMESPAEYVVGATVVVRYDPSDPAQSTLERV